ncbi:hypothetical protein ILYODFUR_022256 [Ilyodon furcidens]|uniref:Uncharacterized protein n=1 Tax=Ilyodon furcidens TaxID=33524 RepID=A0ABV0TYK8_9TELE
MMWGDGLPADKWNSQTLTEEEEMPEVEIDIDDLLEVNNDDERASKLQESLIDCYKPTEVSLFGAQTPLEPQPAPSMF